MQHTATPIILLMGPSGVGKTTLAEWIATDWNYVHIDYDQWGGDEAAFAPLRAGWNELKTTGNVQQFRELIENNIPTAVSGVVLSFPSDDMVVELSVLKCMKAQNMYVVILYADAVNCRKTFIQRELENGRGLPVEHWDKYNQHIYESGYLTSKHQPYILHAYNSKQQRFSRDGLLQGIKEHIYNA